MHGRNELPPPAVTPWIRVLLRQFVSPLIAILVVAAVVTFALQHWVDAIAILIVLIIATGLGFWQECKAEREVRALQSLTTTVARVRRDGDEHLLDAAELVPGDVVVVTSGDRVPADLRLLRQTGLRVDESMLTGESIAAEKSLAAVDADASIGDRVGMLFSGTFVTSGRGVGVVAATGTRTELGAINELVQGPAPRTPLQVLTNRLERRIAVTVMAAVGFVVIGGLIGGYTLDDMFRTAVALSVAAIPESLPIVLTVAMSIGISRMARRHAIVRTLPAVETLGSTTVIASDKTGTLTQNRLTVERVWTANGHVDDAEGLRHPLVVDVLRTGALANEAMRTGDGRLQGDAVDVAMARIALDAGALTEVERTARPAARTPYEPVRRYSQSVHRDAEGRPVLHVKGAPDTLARWSVALAGADRFDPEVVLAANDELGSDGMRVIATATRVLDSFPVDGRLGEPSGLTFLGLEGMTDPPRPGVAEAIADCHHAGIAVTMVTGDHPVTAQSIAARLGIDADAAPLTGTEMADLDDDALAERLSETRVAARVAPQDKLRIVQVLQERGEVVAVTGDGVNDAPALKAAAIGVAMGESGTEVAREAADLVLADDDFVTIVHAVEQGRVTFAAIRKATFFLLSTAVASILSLSLNVLLDQPLLFLPVQILWINLVTSGIQDIALAFEPAEGDELRRPPRSRYEGVLSRTLWARTAITGVWMGLVVLGVFTWSIAQGHSDEHARTLAMVTFVLFNFFQVGNARGEQRSLFLISPFSNRLLLLTSVGAILLLWAVISWPVSAGLLGVTPLSFAEWFGAWVLAGSVLVIVEVEKLIRLLVHRAER